MCSATAPPADGGGGDPPGPGERPAQQQHHEYRTDVEESHRTSDLHFRLQDENAALADPASENDVLQLLNSTDGELSGLSHLDAPISDSVYMIGGVLIAMVLVGLIIVLLAVTISKLRKREETNNNSLGHGHNPNRLVHAAPAVPSGPPPLQPLQLDSPAKVAYVQSHAGFKGVGCAADAAANTTSPTTPSSDSDGADGEEDKAPLELFLWSSCPNQQLAMFNGTQDSLVRALPCETPQDSKGLRKNLRGKLRRLVKKKAEDACAIPPELRDQLKQIYVY